MSQADKHLYNSSPARTNGLGNTFNTTRSIHHAKVTDVLEGHRIKARIDGMDNRLSDEELPICHAILPLFLKVNPTVGEIVTILLSDVAQPYDDRLWIGPAITQYQYLDGQPYLASTINVNRDGFYKQHEQENPRTRAEAEGLFSDEKNSEEQVWNSRGTTDITQKKNQVIIRAGKNTKDNPLVKNNVNPATLGLHVSEDSKTTSFTAIADKLYLIGHNGDPIVPITRTGAITDDLINQLEENTHPAALTNHLIDFLDLFRQAFMLHAHGYDGMTLLKTAVIKKLEEFDLSLIASKAVRVN